MGGLLYRHETINHGAGEYVRGDVTTNGIESVDGTAILGTRAADRGSRNRRPDGRHGQVEAPCFVSQLTQEKLNGKTADLMEIATEQQNQTYRTRPEPGQLVEVRRRQWVVAEVVSSKLTSMSAQQNSVKDTVYAWISKRNMPAHRIGRLWKFKSEEVDEWVRSGGAAESEGRGKE